MCWYGVFIADSFEQAKQYREKFRAQESAVYNVNRVVEQPIPSLEPPTIATAEEETENDNETNVIQQPSDEHLMNENGHEQNRSNFEISSEVLQPIVDDGNDEIGNEIDGEFTVEVDTVTPSIENSEKDNRFNESSAICGEAECENVDMTTAELGSDQKCSFQTVHVGNDESNAFNNLVNVAVSDLNLAANEKASVNADGEIEITKTYDDDLLCTYIHGKIPIPRDPQYMPKIHDCVTDNIPFKENANKDRAYYVLVGQTYTEIKLSAQLLKGLSMFNQPNFRKNAAFDKSFVKSLLIGIFTVQAIRNGEKIHADLIKFIREIFIIRIKNDDENGSRYLAFNNMINVSIMEIKNNNFV